MERTSQVLQRLVVTYSHDGLKEEEEKEEKEEGEEEEEKSLTVRFVLPLIKEEPRSKERK